jgi:hypothetical protein
MKQLVESIEDPVNRAVKQKAGEHVTSKQEMTSDMIQYKDQSLAMDHTKEQGDIVKAGGITEGDKPENMTKTGKCDPADEEDEGNKGIIIKHSLLYLKKEKFNNMFSY